MKEITKCLMEWNAIIEALGKGEQTILIRNYNNNVKEFLLYPSVNYAINKNVFQNFKSEYHDFVEKYLLPNSKGKRYEIKYYAKVEKVLKKTPRSVSNLNKFHIWDKHHVNNFVRGKKPHVWVLRVYKLNNPQFLNRTNGMRYANVNEKVKLDNLIPVLTDEEFYEVLNKL